ncbi:MAG: phosphorylcholine transferase LicD, partial [Prevotella sp.]
MPEYDLKQLHGKILDILSAIDETCKKYNLRYYLIAGTMLGAVRHKGFIPWDDDADVCMPHSDYDKLIEHASEWLPKRYELICAENDKHYPQPFAKIQDSQTTLIEHAHLRYLGGVYVDVFPVDGMPDGKLAQRLHYFHYKHLCKLLYFTYRDPYRHGHGPSCWLPLLCRKFFTVEGLQRSIRKMLTKYDFYTSRHVLCFDD